MADTSSYMTVGQFDTIREDENRFPRRCGKWERPNDEQGTWSVTESLRKKDRTRGPWSRGMELVVDAHSVEIEIS